MKKIEAPTTGLYYSEDFDIYTVTFYATGTYRKDSCRQDYKINDKAYRISPVSADTHRYKIEGNKLTLYYKVNNDDDARTYIKGDEE